jgi:hypothetical protein
MAKSFISGLKLDARPDRLDLRDRPYDPPVVSLPDAWPPNDTVAKLLPLYVRSKLILDQGEDGACTGFGLACVVNYLLWIRQPPSRARKFEQASPRMLYHLARFYDEWQGEDYEGSSCRGAMKAWHKHGVCSERRWPYRNKNGEIFFVPPSKEWDVDAATRPLGVYYRVNNDSVVDMQAAIHQVGAIYVSADVHDGWELKPVKLATVTHDSLPVIKPPKSSETGGHAFAIVGYNRHGFVVQNSWGEKWGANGFAVLPYEDWVENGSDAWVCALGVPVVEARSSSHFVRGTPEERAGRGSPIVFRTSAGHAYRNREVEPWSTERAYLSTIVMGNNGRVINRIVTEESARSSVERVGFTETDTWMKTQVRSGTKKIMIYAHGGLNSEDDSIKRIRCLAPYFEANGIYPLFLTWKTGPLETIASIIVDELAKLPFVQRGFRDLLEDIKDKAAEALDRTVEAVCHVAVKPIWSEMKESAGDASSAGGGGNLLADALRRLRQQHPTLEIHLIGHSAGSILLGHMLGLFGNGLRAESCTLYAPACTVAFANKNLVPAVAVGKLVKNQLHLHLLNDERERGDTVGPYRKSLLYLVSRALEDCHKMPLLGLARVFDKDSDRSGLWNKETTDDVVAWQQFWQGQQANLHPLEQREVSDGTGMIRTAHGSFDNDVAVVGETIRRILGHAPTYPVENLRY